MKVVLASYIYSPGYTDPATWLKYIRFYTGVLDAMAANGNQIISIQQIDYQGSYVQNGVSYEFLKLSKSQRLIPLKLHGFIKKQNPDVVIVQGLHSPLQVIQLRLQLGRNVKIILQNHAEKPFASIKRYFHTWADRVVDAYLFASKDLGLNWVRPRRLISENKIHEVMEVSSVFKQIVRKEAMGKTKLTGKPIFLWVGRLNENKDPLTVIKGFLKFATHCSSARLYMIYQTDELLPEINLMLANHPQKSAVFLIGKIPNEELLYWYNSADVIISGSHYEGSGTAVCEAMSCGCIPVVTDIPSFRMITNSGDCGLLYSPGDEETLFRQLQKTQTIDTEQYRVKCLDWFEQKLSFKAIAGDIENVINSIIK